MENRRQEISAKKSRRVTIDIIPGHFATNHSHVDYYVDMAKIKTSATMAKSAAEILSMAYMGSTPIDTIICMEGTEVLGAFLAEALASQSTSGINRGKNISVITPELNSNNQLIFRDNLHGMVYGKQILLLIASASTGKTIGRAIECLQYYNGNLAGIASIFSAIGEMRGIQINSIFTVNDLPGYHTYLSTECPMCKNKQKIDAIANSFGYSKI